jgi:hypothetical protein
VKVTHRLGRLDVCERIHKTFGIRSERDAMSERAMSRLITLVGAKGLEPLTPSL